MVCVSRQAALAIRALPPPKEPAAAPPAAHAQGISAVPCERLARASAADAAAVLSCAGKPAGAACCAGLAEGATGFSQSCCARGPPHGRAAGSSPGSAESSQGQGDSGGIPEGGDGCIPADPALVAHGPAGSIGPSGGTPDLRGGSVVGSAAGEGVLPPGDLAGSTGLSGGGHGVGTRSMTGAAAAGKGRLHGDGDGANPAEGGDHEDWGDLTVVQLRSRCHPEPFITRGCACWVGMLA